MNFATMVNWFRLLVALLLIVVWIYAVLTNNAQAAQAFGQYAAPVLGVALLADGISNVKTGS